MTLMIYDRIAGEGSYRCSGRQYSTENMHIGSTDIRGWHGCIHDNCSAQSLWSDYNHFIFLKQDPGSKGA